MCMSHNLSIIFSGIVGENLDFPFCVTIFLYICTNIPNHEGIEAEKEPLLKSVPKNLIAKKT